jgi:hypothetical protein
MGTMSCMYVDLQPQRGRKRGNYEVQDHQKGNGVPDTERVSNNKMPNQTTASRAGRWAPLLVALGYLRSLRSWDLMRLVVRKRSGLEYVA